MDDSPRTQRYHRTHRALSLTGFLLDLAVLVILLFTGWTVALRSFAESVNSRPALALLVFLGLFGILTKTVGLPIDFLKGFWLEHRYGVSNLTFGGWVKDQLKGLAVGGLLAAVGLECFYSAARRWPEHWWIAVAILFAGFFVLLANLAPVVIFPLFFKFKPLDRPSLTQRLTELSARAGARVRGIFEWKLSEKSKKANAALVGLGNTRRIILADTLLEKFRDDEVEAVLAHELGHHVHRHVFQALLIQTGATFLGSYLLHMVLARQSARFGFAGPADFANLPLVALVITVLSLGLLPWLNAHSRFMERQADRYALRVIPDTSAFISGMEKLAELNLAERRPPAWIEFLFHSHPSIEKRITFARAYRGEGREESFSSRASG
jgi:STE24 endopeptidase